MIFRPALSFSLSLFQHILWVNVHKFPLFMQGVGPSAGVCSSSKLQDPLLHLKAADLSDAVWLRAQSLVEGCCRRTNR
jgi:hypothetical protein